MPSRLDITIILKYAAAVGAPPMEYKCGECSKTFRDKRDLARHESRKTPCAQAPVPQPEGSTAIASCKYCARPFSSKQAMYRHVRQSCKTAPRKPQGGPQAAAQGGPQAAAQAAAQVGPQGGPQVSPPAEASPDQLSSLTAKIDKMAEQLKQLIEDRKNASEAPPPPGQVLGQISISQAGPVAIVQNVQNVQTIVINPWDGDNRLGITMTDVTAALAENPLLRDYARMGTMAQVDPERAPPYVMELLMDLLRRGHATPESRNVHLNPSRSDQVLVHMKSGRWEVLPLALAARAILDGMVKTFHTFAISAAETRALPVEAQAVLGSAGAMYMEAPELYVDGTKAPLVAHLTNMIPRK